MNLAVLLIINDLIEVVDLLRMITMFWKCSLKNHAVLKANQESKAKMVSMENLVSMAKTVFQAYESFKNNCLFEVSPLIIYTHQTTGSTIKTKQSELIYNFSIVIYFLCVFSHISKLMFL